MRHRNKKAILNRPADQRKALIRNLLTSLFLSGKVKTTEAKAKALTVEANKLIAKVKSQNNFNAIRSLKQVIFTEESAKKAIEFISTQKAKTSGFTRLTKVGMRAGDNACLAQVELIANIPVAAKNKVAQDAVKKKTELKEAVTVAEKPKSAPKKSETKLSKSEVKPKKAESDNESDKKV